MKNARPFLLFGLITLFACSNPRPQVTPIDVQHAGALRQMMHQGDISPKADLKELENTPHVYALGALAELKGEVLIWDGKPLMAQAVDGEVAVRGSFDHEAALLVYSAVAEWYEVGVPDSVQSYAQLESYVEFAAKELGINTEKPFPFLVEGRVVRADWHVIDWLEGDTVHSHQKHVTSGPHGQLENEELQVLGFYSKHHHAIFTHHSTNMHLHGKTTDNAWAAHIDDIELMAGGVLKLPVR